MARLKLAFSCLTIAVALTSQVGRPQDLPGRGKAISEKRIDAFYAEQLSLVDCLLRLGQFSDVPMGIEYVDEDALLRPITMNLPSGTVAMALDKILAMGRGYSWRVEGKTIVITNDREGSDVRLLLERNIKNFSIPKATLASADQVLRMTLIRELQPGVTGFVGSYSPSKSTKTVGPIEAKNQSLRHILSLLVGSHGRSAWIWTANGGRPNEKANGLSDLWVTVEYEKPPASFAALLNQKVDGFKKNPRK